MSEAKTCLGVWSEVPPLIPQLGQSKSTLGCSHPPDPRVSCFGMGGRRTPGCVGVDPGTNSHSKCVRSAASLCQMAVRALTALQQHEGSSPCPASEATIWHLGQGAWPGVFVSVGGKAEAGFEVVPIPPVHTKPWDNCRGSVPRLQHQEISQMTPRHSKDEGRLRAEAELQKNVFCVCPLRCEPLGSHRMLFSLLQVMPEIWSHK